MNSPLSYDALADSFYDQSSSQQKMQLEARARTEDAELERMWLERIRLNQRANHAAATPNKEHHAAHRAKRHS